MDNQQIKLFGSKNSDEWETPQGLYEELDEEFAFDLDASATSTNFKHKNYYSIQDDALAQPWDGVVWCNPPYSKIKAFLNKAHEELRNGNCKAVVFLTFSNTDTAWFHDYVLGKAEIRFIRGRLKFKGMNKEGKLVNNSAMRPSMLAILRSSIYHGMGKK